MYTKWLIAPAVLGIVTFILSNRSEITRDWCILFFNIFNIVWATLFLEAWKRKSAELAYKWGTMDMPSDALKEPRPLFRVRYLHSELIFIIFPRKRGCLLEFNRFPLICYHVYMLVQTLVRILVILDRMIIRIPCVPFVPTPLKNPSYLKCSVSQNGYM